MKKKVSFKSISNESSEIEPIILTVDDIDKTEIFNNNSEIIIKNILEKIILNAFSIIKSKEIDCLIERRCSNFAIQEINTLISQHFICYEKEDYFFSECRFMDNYIREEPSWDECELPQPTPGKMDRWKIHRMEIKNLKYRNKSQISEMSEGPSMIYDKKTFKSINKVKFTKLTKKYNEEQKREKERAKEEEEKLKNRKKGIKDMDTFPSYPLADDIFKVNVNLTKEEEEQIELYRAELLIKEEMKKKENEKKEMIEKLKNGPKNKNDDMLLDQKMKNNNKRLKGKTIGVTTNGEIIFIQNVNIDQLKSEFLEINTKMKNLRNPTTKKKIFGSGGKNNNLDIEKNVNDEANLDFFKINNKDRLAQQIITGGSSFKNFVPEIGVNLKQNGNIKSGGTDFLNKYKKISLEQFEKTLEIFKRTNHPNNEIIDKKNEEKSRNNNSNNINSSNNNNSNILNSTNLINNNNNINYNYINQHSLVKSNSLPELNHINSKSNFEGSNVLNANNNAFFNNDSNIKNSFYFTNYNNSNIMNSTKYNNMNNFIKTSSSFKNLFFKEENPFYKDEEVIPMYTTKQFFKIFNPKIKNLSKINKQKNISLTKIQNFNKDILNNKNWGEETSIITRNKYRVKPFINTVKKNFFNKTLSNNFRVRKNVNENYQKKMFVFNKISLISQSTGNNAGIKFEKKN